VSPDNAIGRLTRLDAMQATSMRQALGRDHEVELRQIARALKSMDEGTYGICRRRRRSFGVLAAESEVTGRTGAQ
jgi:DnaK suppressor protein